MRLVRRTFLAAFAAAHNGVDVFVFIDDFLAAFAAAHIFFRATTSR